MADERRSDSRENRAPAPPSADAPPSAAVTLTSFGKQFVRPVGIPSREPTSSIHRPAQALTEVAIQRPGTVPVRAVVPSDQVTPELLRSLESEAKDLPRLPVNSEQGAVDVRLEDPNGAHVKGGTVILEGPRGSVAVPIDSATRRFRLGSLAPGDYRLQAASAVSGRATLPITVRPGDVARAAVRLDGAPARGRGSMRFALPGSDARQVRVRATDRDTGQVVLEQTVNVTNHRFEVAVRPGRIHWDIFTDDARSCYDADVDDGGLLSHLEDLVLELVPEIGPLPDPPDWKFGGLPRELAGVGRVLPELGISSLEELAAAEPEDLMHRAASARGADGTPIQSRLFAQAIDAARSHLGVSRSAPEERAQLRLAEGATFTRQVVPRAPGEVELNVDVGPGNRAEVRIRRGGRTTVRTITGSERLSFPATAADVAAGRAVQVSVKNVSKSLISGSLQTRVPVESYLDGFVLQPPSVKGMIERIYEALAVQNPGISTQIPDAVLSPENIQMWMDRGRTMMMNAGVCSMNDLGRFRLQPMPVLHTGVYVAPVVQPPTKVTPLGHYAFSELLSNSVLYYKPNDVLHDTAVVLAGEWDIRGQSVVIGQEVRELFVIVGSIRHDALSQITWQTPTLPSANTYWPSPAPNGGDGVGAGADGAPGGDGDSNPHPSKNGGADAVTPAPIITMYILDSTNNVPPIFLRGQDGGVGGRGQDGGRGGNGVQGLRACGTFFGGCCRGVGWGGDGGQGGDGGRGGKGGKGGPGGAITLLTTPPGIAVMDGAPPTIDVRGGLGGPGGPAGSAGPGGVGGPAGTADCETWCDEHPERRGTDGAGGAAGAVGFLGDPGPLPVEDSIQILPITEEQWYQVFNNPHILDVNPDDVEPGQTVQITGLNFDPSIDRIFFDGVDVGAVSSAAQASFVVPLDSEGGYHPVVIRPAGMTDRRSNKAIIRVLPKLDAIPAGTRWDEGEAVTLTGLAFRPGLKVLAEDRSVMPAAVLELPVGPVTRTSIQLTIPAAPLGNLRGVRRIVIRNPDGGQSRDERVARISDTIVVRCAAFRVVGTTPGVGTTRSVADITNLFVEGAANSISIPWGQARIAFRLVQPVTTITLPDDQATMWPFDDDNTVQSAQDTTLFTNNGGVNGALNFFFFRDVEQSTAYAWIGDLIVIIGDEGGTVLGPIDFQQVVAHEAGHALCLRHVCGKPGETPAQVALTLFGRACQTGDEPHLMYPYWDASNGMTLLAQEVTSTRIGATHFEDGKTSLAAPFAINQCAAEDALN